MPETTPNGAFSDHQIGAKTVPLIGVVSVAPVTSSVSNSKSRRVQYPFFNYFTGPDFLLFPLDHLFVFKKNVLVKMGTAKTLWYQLSESFKFSMITQTQIQDICIYISIHLKHAFFHFGTYPSPLCILLKRYGSSKVVEGTTFLCILLQWDRDRMSSILLKKMWYKNRHFSLYLCTLYALRTISFGLLGLES